MQHFQWQKARKISGSLNWSHKLNSNKFWESSYLNEFLMTETYETISLKKMQGFFSSNTHKHIQGVSWILHLDA